jgi:hypothetical protein
MENTKMIRGYFREILGIILARKFVIEPFLS